MAVSARLVLRRQKAQQSENSTRNRSHRTPPRRGPLLVTDHMRFFASRRSAIERANQPPPPPPPPPAGSWRGWGTRRCGVSTASTSCSWRRRCRRCCCSTCRAAGRASPRRTSSGRPASSRSSCPRCGHGTPAVPSCYGHCVVTGRSRRSVGPSRGSVGPFSMKSWSGHAQSRYGRVLITSWSRSPHEGRPARYSARGPARLSPSRPCAAASPSRVASMLVKPDWSNLTGQT